MANIDVLKEEKLNYSGFFSMKELYEHMYTWLEWRKFKTYEKKYKDKTTTLGREIEIKWESKRDIDEYSKVQITTEWEVKKMTEEEVVENGKKTKTNKGEIEIKVSAKLETDYNLYFEHSPFLKFMKGFYEKYLYKSSIDNIKDDLWKQGWDYYNEIKSFLNVYKFSIKS